MLLTMKTEILIDLKGEKESAFAQLYKDYFGMVNRFAQNQKHKCVEQIKKVKEQEKIIKL